MATDNDQQAKMKSDLLEKFRRIAPTVELWPNDWKKSLDKFAFKIIFSLRYTNCILDPFLYRRLRTFLGDDLALSVTDGRMLDLMVNMAIENKVDCEIKRFESHSDHCTTATLDKSEKTTHRTAIDIHCVDRRGRCLSLPSARLGLR